MLSKNIKEDFKYILRFMNIIQLLIVWMLMNLGKLYMNLDKNFKKFRDGENSSIQMNCFCYEKLYKNTSKNSNASS